MWPRPCLGNGIHFDISAHLQDLLLWAFSKIILVLIFGSSLDILNILRYCILANSTFFWYVFFSQTEREFLTKSSRHQSSLICAVDLLVHGDKCRHGHHGTKFPIQIRFIEDKKRHPPNYIQGRIVVQILT